MYYRENYAIITRIFRRIRAEIDGVNNRMKVGIGYSDNPESIIAGVQAVKMALSQGGRTDSCDMIFLFSTARHDPVSLRKAVASVVGEGVPVYGGGAAGVITNDYFGYAGDQVACACMWFEGGRCDTVVVDDLDKGEEEAGVRLGKGLAQLGVCEDSPVLMFYDAIEASNGVRLLMATWLLEGIQKGLGFFPDMTGAGFMGDHICTPTKQWTGEGIGEFHVMAHVFSGDIRIDSEIMHGCHPASQYYTVTKASGPVILEINGEPAIPFIDKLLGGSVPPEEFPFFLIFGVNHGEPWGEYDEDHYASRLCLGIDEGSGGIVMFEPDMVEGTQFQVMFRSVEMDYIKPKIDRAFDRLGDREPVFALYIDCAGRCAGYEGMGAEDAVFVQEAVAGRVPLLGLYTGVEIASIGGRPRGLDWTGVFCLFSKSKDGSVEKKAPDSRSVWGEGQAEPADKRASMEALARMSQQNMAKAFALDTHLKKLSFELELKRRGFSLLSELAVSLRKNENHTEIFSSVTRRINAALNMQRTLVLVPSGGGFTPRVFQGYTTQEQGALSGQVFNLPQELLDTDKPVMVTGADSQERFGEFRALIGLPYFISFPIVIFNEISAILIAGRVMEAAPFLLRLGHSDAETIQAICALLVSVLADKRVAAAEERAQVMLDATPLGATFWNREYQPIDCNLEAVRLFKLSDKTEYISGYFELSPECQPCGKRSREMVREKIDEAFEAASCRFEWMHQLPDGEQIPCEITLVRVKYMDDFIVVSFTRDLREFKAMLREMTRAEIAEESNRAKSKFLATMSHEIRTPMNAVMGITEIQLQDESLNPDTREAFNRIYSSSNTLLHIINDILDLSRIEAGRLDILPAEYKLGELIHDAAQLNIMRINSKPIEFVVQVDEAAPAVLVGDELRIKQVLSNLLSNAFKYTEKGRVNLTVSMEHGNTVEDTNVTMIFQVKDTGQGMTQEQLQSMFEEYSRFNLVVNAKIEGTGLGMRITQHLIEMMHGSLTIESKPGVGTVCTMRLPQYDVGSGVLGRDLAESLRRLHRESGPKDAKKAILRKYMPEARVLVVDDAETNLYVAKKLMSFYGMSIDTALSGREALLLIARDKKYDMIFMDHMMPEMDGIEVVRNIRAMGFSDPYYKYVPIVALTANAITGTKEMLLGNGFNDYLSKPIDLFALNDVLEQWIPKVKQLPPRTKEAARPRG